jgi:hypothetical protein
MQGHLQKHLQSEEMIQSYIQTAKLDVTYLFDLTADRYFGEGQIQRDRVEGGRSLERVALAVQLRSLPIACRIGPTQLIAIARVSGLEVLCIYLHLVVSSLVRNRMRSSQCGSSLSPRRRVFY